MRWMRKENARKEGRSCPKVASAQVHSANSKARVPFDIPVCFLSTMRTHIPSRQPKTTYYGVFDKTHTHIDNQLFSPFCVFCFPPLSRLRLRAIHCCFFFALLVYWLTGSGRQLARGAWLEAHSVQARHRHHFCHDAQRHAVRPAVLYIWGVGRRGNTATLRGGREQKG